MLRTRSNPSTSTPNHNTTPPSQNLTPGPAGVIEPDTPLGHYDSRTHVHATPEHEINPHEQAFVKSRMNGNSEGLAARRGEKGMILNGLSRLQNLGGGKGKGKAQYRLGTSDFRYMFSYRYQVSEPALTKRTIASGMASCNSHTRSDPDYETHTTQVIPFDPYTMRLTISIIQYPHPLPYRDIPTRPPRLHQRVFDRSRSVRILPSIRSWGCYSC